MSEGDKTSSQVRMEQIKAHRARVAKQIHHHAGRARELADTAENQGDSDWATGLATMSIAHGLACVATVIGEAEISIDQ